MSKPRNLMVRGLSLIVAGGLLVLTGCSSGGAGSETAPDSNPDASAVPGEIMSDAEWSKVVDAANEEGEVVVYGQMGAGMLEVMPVEFAKAYPSIKLTYVRLSGADTEARLDAEFAAGSAIADVVDNLDNQVIDAYADQGELMPLTFPALADPEFDEKANLRTPYSAMIGSVPFAWAWNTDLLPDGIDSWQDFLDLDSSLVGTTDPSITKMVPPAYVSMERPNTGGAGYLDRLMANGTPQIYAGSNPAITALAAGEVGALLPVPAGNVLAAQADGAPIDYKIYEGAVNFTSEMSVVQRAPHPNAAQVYANWLLSEAGQQAVADGGMLAVRSSTQQLFDAEGVNLVRLEPLPPEETSAFQQRWATLLAG